MELIASGMMVIGYVCLVFGGFTAATGSREGAAGFFIGIGLVLLGYVLMPVAS